MFEHGTVVRCDACRRKTPFRRTSQGAEKQARRSGWARYSGRYGLELHFCDSCKRTDRAKKLAAAMFRETADEWEEP